MSVRPYVLIVDDDPGVCRMIQRSLELVPIASDVAGSIEEAKEKLESTPVGVGVLDVKLPVKEGQHADDAGGVALARWMRANHPDCPIIFITGGADTSGDSHLAYTVLQKPIDMRRLVREIRELMFRVEMQWRMDRQDRILDKLLDGQKASARWLKAVAGLITVITPLVGAVVQWLR